MSGRGKSRRTMELIDAAVRILEEIQPATVRAVCYRLFVEKLIPSMEKTNTNRVSTQLVYARENEIIPWDWIVDDGRQPLSWATWDNPAEYLRSVADGYRRGYWQDQPALVEVWSEKGTVRGTLEPILSKWGVTFRVMRGHGSATVLHNVAAMADESDKHLIVLYVGDRDPSGMHMSEIDIPSRLARYSEYEGNNITFVRIAISEEDALPAAGVPSFQAADKTGDPRYAWYVSNYGTKCWELDALSPAVLRDRIDKAILNEVDAEAWNHAVRTEQAEMDSMATFFRSHPAISGQAQKSPGDRP